MRFKHSTTISTVLFPKSSYTPTSARAWALKNGFKVPKIDEGGPRATMLRIRQHPPGYFQPRTFRTIQLGEQVEAVVGVPKQGAPRRNPARSAVSVEFRKGRNGTSVYVDGVGVSLDHDSWEEAEAAARKFLSGVHIPKAETDQIIRDATKRIHGFKMPKRNPSRKGAKSAAVIHRRGVEASAREWSKRGGVVITRYGDVFRGGKKAGKPKKRNPSARVWRLASDWGRAEGYPETVPFHVSHFEAAWDYSGPVWDRTEKQKSGGVWAKFTKAGKQTYMGDSAPSYRLEGT